MKRKSPYSPTEPITARNRLIGRDQEVVDVVTAIRAGRNVVISGERGVGKTSLATVVAAMCKAPRKHSDGSPLAPALPPALTAYWSCSGESTIDSVVDGLLHSLSRSSGIDLTAVNKTGSNVKASVGGVGAEIRVETESQRANSAAALMVESIMRARGIGTGHGDSPIILIIDEADRAAASAGLGVFVRTSKEMATAEGARGVSFVLVGQKGLMAQLQREHPSAPRSFEFVWLTPLSIEACKEVLSRGEQLSGVKFDPEIQTAIAHASKGFPAVVQRLADSCFQVDRDQYIDVLDFEDGLSRTIDRIRGEETLESLTLLSGTSGREVMLYLARSPGFSSAAEVTAALGSPADHTLAILEQLTSVQILEREGDGYLIADRLLGAYVALEETRKRSVLDVRELARALEHSGYSVRAVTPGEHRGIDLILTTEGWKWIRRLPIVGGWKLFRRRIAVTYVGEAGRLGPAGIRHLAPQLDDVVQVYGVDELWLVGEGRLTRAAENILEELERVRYIPRELVGRVQ